MKKEDVLPIYKILVKMKELAEKLGEADEKKDESKISELKLKIMELQRGLKGIL